MAKIFMLLREGQNLGYVQIRDGKPYYGYSKTEATEMTVEQAKQLACSFKPDTYIVRIVCKKQEIEPVWKPYEIVVE